MDNKILVLIISLVINPEKSINMNNYQRSFPERLFVKRHFLQIFLIFFLQGFIVSGQNDTTRTEQRKGPLKPEISLFGSDKILNVSIYMDLGSFLKKTTPTASFDADMHIITAPGDTIKKKVSLKYRGIIRKEMCSFPPIEVNFVKSLICDTEKIKRIKLVTHCEPGSKTDEYVLREYLCYKLFNAITDTSFKARLLKVSYIDTKKIKKTITKYGIFIEPVEMLAARTNSVIVKSTNLNQNHIIPHVMDRVAIFNYMISNWDWSVPGQHNVKILQQKMHADPQLGIAVPYDFDLTGVVNAEYAVPPPNVPIETVRQRLFWGLCRNREVYIADLKEFSDHREAIYSVINDCPYLNKSSKKDIAFFLKEFFDNLEKPKSINNLIDEFLKTCKY
jgi:hypothetical protein